MATKKPKPRSGPGSRIGKDARSGPNVPEAERTARLVSLRLTPEDRELLDQLAEEYGSRSAVLREGMALLVKRKG
jgi:hypothetical protein